MDKAVMNQELPGIIVTGASGFVGRHFLEAANGRFRLFCLARRSQFEAAVPRMENQRWTQVDIAQRDALLDVASCVNGHGGADTVLHLAGYYDFTYKDNPEYQRTNVLGTQNVLDLAEAVGAKRFIYASSIAACRFPKDGEAITEDTSPDADFPYARSKRDAEKLIRESTGGFARSVLRLAALYSDWCEYPPVFAFLKTWLSPVWNTRMLGGRGASAVPYLHINDLVTLIMRVIERSPRLPDFAIYNASPSQTTSHQQIYCAATRFLYGQECRPIHVPRIIAQPGIALRQAALDFIGHPPFERTWMMKYIDKDLRVDASRTHAALDWQPSPRYDLRRRLLILIENMKNHPEVWQMRNEAAFVRAARRPNFVMSNHLRRHRADITRDVVESIRIEQQRWDFHDYRRMTDTVLEAYVELFFEVLVAAIRTRDRAPVRTYVRMLAFHRKRQGFDMEHVCSAIETFRHVMRAYLIRQHDPIVTAAGVNEYVDLSLQLALDEIEETYAQLEARDGEEPREIEDVNLLANHLEMVRLVDELHDMCRDGWDISSLLDRMEARS